jgi:hypothetical protein
MLPGDRLQIMRKLTEDRRRLDLGRRDGEHEQEIVLKHRGIGRLGRVWHMFCLWPCY